MSKKKLLITGGAGFIGSQVVKKLCERYEITILDHTFSRETPFHKLRLAETLNLKIVEGEVTNPSVWATLEHDFDVLIHAAAMLGVKKVINYPYQTMIVNGIGTYYAIDFALKQKALSRFINFSTSEIYGASSRNVSERYNAIIPSDGPRWGYASSKLFGESLTKSAFYEHRLPSVTIRPFNVYGPSRTGENGMTNLIVNALKNDPITIIGSGDQCRAWCHVSDFVEGVCACVDTENIDGEVFNIGNDLSYITMNELAEIIIRETGSKSLILHTEDTDDISERQPDLTKAREMLMYDPIISVEEGIKDMIKYLRAA